MGEGNHSLFVVYFDLKLNILKKTLSFQVQFKDYSSDECKKRWLFVLTRLRHYRIMAEVLDEAVQWVDQPWTNFNKGSKVLDIHSHFIAIGIS